MRKWIIFFILIVPHILSAQTDVSFGILPRIIISKKVDKVHGIKFTSETRQGLYHNINTPAFKSSNLLSDFALYYSNRLDPDYSANFGYLIRYSEGDILHRFIQQFNFIQRIESARLGHRIGIDQSFATNHSAVYRIRYRTVYEKSFSGERIDSKEFYYKFGAELLYSASTGPNRLEFRLLPMVGYELAINRKIEFGIDARAKALFSDDAASQHWFRLTAYLGI